jgi:gamma-glutamyl:cysteine ligase YbdK (ATP-grasp superfamily)
MRRTGKTDAAIRAAPGAGQAPERPLHAFSAYGIELEYMLVDRDSLDVRPLAGEVLATMAGHAASRVERGRIGWSNELVQHVIELKNVEPEPGLDALKSPFAGAIATLDRALAAHDARLMPSGMHPWMDPLVETWLWTQSDAAIYCAFDRVFGCRRHGWSNLQSMHVNLPFAGDVEFARLHAAVRCVLPLVPALAASSPIADGERKASLDYRLEVYRANADPLRSIAGQLVPEPVSSRADYEARILAPMYREIEPYDPQGTLQHEWLNSRGAIARFDRSAIEIRLADTQECPRADLAVAAAIIAAARMLHDERYADHRSLDAIETGRLALILSACIRDAEEAIVDDADYLALFGLAPRRCRAGDLWTHVIGQSSQTDGAESWREAWATILDHGTLARRILKAVGEQARRPRLEAVYAELCDCLFAGRLLVP